jgi:hypothetical protein
LRWISARGLLLSVCALAVMGVVFDLAIPVSSSVVIVTRRVSAAPTSGATVPGQASSSGARASAATSTAARTWGVTLPDVPADPSALQQLEGATGQSAGVVMWYVAWSLNSAFPIADASRVQSWGGTPEITWEPWDPAAGIAQPSYALARIAGGAFDSYLESWAQSIKAWGHPLRIRFAQEMNGNWYPWAQGVNGNAAGSYAAAWTHIRAVFAAAGATDVTWVWSPNVPFPGSTPLADVFPGNQAVDEVALDGYNWSTLQPGSTWSSFADVFGDGIGQLGALSDKPISIGEVGCPEVGGMKSQWIADMWHTLAGWPQVRGLIWFDFDKETDWRIDSSPSSLTAFAAGLPAYLAD